MDSGDGGGGFTHILTDALHHFELSSVNVGE